MFVDGEVGGKEQQNASMVLTEWGGYLRSSNRPTEDRRI